MIIDDTKLTPHSSEVDELEVEQKELRPTTQRSLRSLAFHILYALDRNDYSIPLSFVLEDFREGFDVKFTDDCFAVTITKGVLEYMQEIDGKMLPLLQNWTPERLGCCTVIILRMAFWELLHTKTAPQIIINEAIELAKAFAEKDAYKFINGVLDTYCTRANIKIENHIKEEPGEELDYNDIFAE